jgi:hypothetical protein
MVDPQTTLGEQLLDLAIGERKAQVPADREQDHLRLKLAPLEQSGNRWGEEHRPNLSGQTPKLATLPYYKAEEKAVKITRKYFVSIFSDKKAVLRP